MTCTQTRGRELKLLGQLQEADGLQKKYLKVTLSVTWKVHCVTAHLEDMLTRQGKGMAHFAEQTGEAAHHKMKPVLGRHGRAEMHKDHGQRQLTAITKFASWNLKDVTQMARKGSR